MNQAAEVERAASTTGSIRKHALQAILFAALAVLFWRYAPPLALPADRSMVHFVRNLSIFICSLALIVYFGRVVMTARIRMSNKARYPIALWLVQVTEAVAKITAFIYFYGFARGLLDMDHPLFKGSFLPWASTIQKQGNYLALVVLVILVVAVVIRTSFVRPAVEKMPVVPENDHQDHE